MRKIIENFPKFNELNFDDNQSKYRQKYYDKINGKLGNIVNLRV
jgi:hypothetical protein